MAMSNRESKKGKGIAFKSAYEQETTVNQSDNEVNQDESIALLTKQFSKMARKFKSMNTAGTTVKTRRHDGENSIRKTSEKCKVAFTTIQTPVDAWKLGHISMRSLDKVIRNEAVVGIPSLDINGKFFCGDCQVGKKTKISHKSLKECYTIRVFELLHLDLMGLMQTESLGGKKYVLVVVDDYSRFTWVLFLKGKSDTVKLCISLCLNLQREKGKKIIRISSDHGKEFDNEDLNNFCQSKGIHHEFVAPITP
ncbi:Peptidase aspartic, catalytic [Cucumis melo var. makuwa]|uniref:Peptidase aspartic, catalytic n=1 Tax=Cucumis melo var. makuwa TaxID=1194695 RepID=A0A5D3C456_CUCMM|nr:Peptidase aspartic, catalytic [Cucumis melo var. makuwa]